MSEQVRRQKVGHETGDAAPESLDGTQTTARDIADELDSILDEIDGVLEENAEEFVKNYVQKGGE